MTTANLRIADAAAIARAADILRAGGLVAFPTETVYGLGADATNDRAVASIFAAKGRPQFNPLIVHVSDLAAAEALVVPNPLAKKLAAKFWPGPLTFVLPRQPNSPISLLASAGLDTIAVRVPSGNVAQKLLIATGKPLAAPSANVSGRVSTTTAEHVAEDFGEAVDLILDDGATSHGLESTVIGFDGGKAVMLRLGAIAREEIEAVAGPLAEAGGKVTSPGQLVNHYAPRADMRLNATAVKNSEALLAFGAHVPDGAAMTLNLSASGDLKEAAANLFTMLRALDASGVSAIAVMPVPEHGLGEAINDRLRRAAAPRA